MIAAVGPAVQLAFNPAPASVPGGAGRDRAAGPAKTDAPANTGAYVAAGAAVAEKSPNGAAASRRVQPASESDKPKDAAPGEDLTEEEERQVRELKQRDAEVRAHEQAHATAGGPYASAPSYEYTVGPDGKRYAVSGEVKIDASAVPNNPEATVRKMDVVIRAALAPADPSPQDMQVARKAQQERLQAQAEIREQKKQETDGAETSGSALQSLALQTRDAYQSAGSRAGDLLSALSQRSVFA